MGEMVLPYHTGYAEYMARSALHTSLFPETAMRLEGFVDSAGALLLQKSLESQREPDFCHNPFAIHKQIRLFPVVTCQ